MTRFSGDRLVGDIDRLYRELMRASRPNDIQ